MDYPKTKLNEFFITDPTEDTYNHRKYSIEDYNLFNKVCQRTNQSVVKAFMENDIDQQSDLIEEVTELARQLSLELSDINVLIRHVKTTNEEGQVLCQNAIKQFGKMVKGMQIVDELLSNCQNGPTQMLKELKAQYVQESPVNAQRADQVNVQNVRLVQMYLKTQFCPQMLKELNNYMQTYKNYGQLLNNLKIGGTQILMINLVLSTAIDTDLNDLMCQSRDNTRWCELMDITVRKSLGNTEQINKSYETFVQSVMMGHALINDQKKYNNKLAQLAIMGFGSMYYTLFKNATANSANIHMSSLSAQNAIQVMNFIEMPGVKHFLNLGLPKIKNNIKFYIDPVVIPITLEQQNKQIEMGTIHTITPITIEYVNQEVHTHHYNIFKKSKQKLRIRLLYNGEVNEEENITSYFKQFFRKQKRKQPEQVVIHIHGGGFISQSSSSHQSYTRQWAIDLDTPIFSIDYSLAPKHPYPSALDDCWQAYHWILKFSEQVFGIVPNKIVLAGDSAGGNLACALIGLLIKFGGRIPDGVILSYPALDIRFSFTPSYLRAVNDKILSHTILGICIESYSANPQSQLGLDPFMNPLMLSYEILKHFPPVRLICGSNDPLYDQIYRFADRLLEVRRDVKITIYEELSHGFLNFNTIKGMSEIQQCLSECVRQMKQLFGQSNN